MNAKNPKIIKKRQEEVRKLVYQGGYQDDEKIIASMRNIRQLTFLTHITLYLK